MQASLLTTLMSTASIEKVHQRISFSSDGSAQSNKRAMTHIFSNNTHFTVDKFLVGQIHTQCTMAHSNKALMLANIYTHGRCLFCKCLNWGVFFREVL